MLKPDKFFTPSGYIYNELFKTTDLVWEAIAQISPVIKKLISPNLSQIRREGSLVLEDTLLENGAMIRAGAYLDGDEIEIGEGALIEPSAYVKGPTIIGKNSVVRHSAYIRGNVILGKNSVAGHSTEIKNSALLEESKAGHFAYIGDSILGAVNLGAGTKLANLKLTGEEVRVKVAGKIYKTGLRKFGAIMGDGVQTGCNSVTMPGTILAQNAAVYPNLTARGYYPAGTIIKLRQNIEEMELNL
ncbi:MAG: glucose-1-phosphate thymidylyltransferase [Elusimicrobia bacterium]|nr:glucose-1-phosphate thymidylyltransferase [Elusimicrobiota bacterium]